MLFYEKITFEKYLLGNVISLNMNIVPFISIKKGLLFDGKNGDKISINDLFKRVEKDTLLYVFDLDGLDYNKPALDMYQKLSEHCDLWIDNGPRCLDDVMDMTMAGATNITLREKNWPIMDLSQVFDLIDNEIFLYIDILQRNQLRISNIFEKDIGIILFNQEPDHYDEFIGKNFLKELAIKHKIYLYTMNQRNNSYWQEWGITGILIDLNKR